MGFVPDHANGLAGYFIGTWRFTRQITDHKSGQDAKVEGIASFSGEGQTLSYTEAGTMNFGAYQGKVTQSYIYEFSGPFEAEILFNDKRLFHPLNLKTGQDTVEHWCAPDQYNGQYYLHNQAKWSLDWKITGQIGRAHV